MHTIDGYEVRQYPDLTLHGYRTHLDLPTMENVQEISAGKTGHFQTLAQSGKFPALMAQSIDHIGYAFSVVEGAHLTYFAGANVASAAADAQATTVPGGTFLILTGQGGPSRQLFDQLIARFFGQILPQHPGLYAEDSFVVEALLNGNALDAVVELRIPISQ